MGRGRAKAKQTKVARELKYGAPDTDLARLQAELAGAPSSPGHHVPDDAVEDDDDLDDDPYAKYVDDEDDDDVASSR